MTSREVGTLEEQSKPEKETFVQPEGRALELLCGKLSAVGGAG